MQTQRSFCFWFCYSLLLASFLQAQTFSSPVSAAPASQMSSSSPALRDSGGGTGSDTIAVAWDQGQLSVIAHRVSLHSVLTAIARKTGMVIESEPGSDAALVYIELGPASMHDVLRQILEGDRADYILLGSRTEPGRVERLIFLRQGQEPANESRQRTNIAAVQPDVAQPDVYENDQGPTEAPPIAPTPQVASDIQEQQAPSTALPPVQNIDAQMSAYQQAFSEAAKSGKTRAEILQELQKQQIKDLDAAASQSNPN